jgi:hypothetical protein
VAVLAPPSEQRTPPIDTSAHVASVAIFRPGIGTLQQLQAKCHGIAATRGDSRV